MRTVKPRQPQTLAKRLGLLQEALNASLGWIADHRDAVGSAAGFELNGGADLVIRGIDDGDRAGRGI